MLNSPHPPNQTTYRKAVDEIRSKIKNAGGASDRRVHIYAFNIDPEQLKDAYNLLDQEESRRAMRVTYSNDHNFIVRYMPGAVHNVAHTYWSAALLVALARLTPLPQASMPPGCLPVGTMAFQLGEKKKQADSGVRPIHSRFPSVVIEVGDSESLTQLKNDARLWLEHMPEVRLVIILSISPPCPPFPNFPSIIVELWRGFLSCMPPPHLLAAWYSLRHAQMVWHADWTYQATPMYILLSDIFRGLVPEAYGNHEHVNLDTEAWRQAIIDEYC